MMEEHPRRERILFVEDVAVDAELAAAELRRSGLTFDSRRVETRDEFVAALREFRPTLVLSDYALPAFDGLSALALTREHESDTPFILVTASINEETAVACMKAGAWDYLLKDRLSRLPLAVGAALARAHTREKDRQAQEALRRSEEQQRAFLLSSGDGVFVKDARFRTALANPAYAELLGRPISEILGREDFEIMPEEMARECRASDLAALRGDLPRITEQEGLGRIFEVRKFPVPLADGSTGVGGYIRDITDRKSAEQALHENRERLRLAMESAGLGFWDADLATGRVTLSERWAAMLGYTLEELGEERNPWKDRVHPDDLPAALEALESHLRGDSEVYETEHRLRCKSGEWIWVLDRGRVVERGSDGTPHRIIGAQRDITEKILAEHRLRESERRYRLIAENTADVIWTLDPTTLRFTFVSPSVQKLRGVTPEEALRQSLSEVLTPESVRRVEASIAKALERLAAGREAGPVVLEIEELTKDGRVIPTEISATALIAEDGRLAGILGVTRNIAARRRAERALRESEERYRSLFENSPLGKYWTTPDGEILDANPTLLAMLGYESLDELRQHSFSDPSFQPDYPRERFKELVEKQGTVRGFEATWHRKDGTAIRVRESAHAARSADGRVVTYVGAVEDITEQTRVQEAHRRLAEVVDQAAEAVVVTDAAGTIEYVNPAFERVTGFTRAEILGQNPRVLKSGQHDDDFYRDLWATITEGRAWHGRLINRRKDGTQYEEEATISPVRDDNGAIRNFVAVKRDVTREVTLQQQLNHAQKMEAVGRLAGGIAHDFNNLLQAMLSHIQLFRADPQSREVELVDLEALVQRGAALARQLLLFSRPEVTRRELLNLNDVLRNSGTLLRRLVRENVELVVAPGEDPLPVEADSGQLGQVLMNLAVNAADAMPSGGRLTIRTGRVGPEVWIETEDTGAGIPAEIRERIFEPFFTTKTAGHGTGLGLSVVHGIVTSHGGRVELNSEVGRGTTFRVVLPAKAGTAEMLPVSSPSGVALPAGHGERVLVVEDEVAARQGLREILVMLGYEITAVGSGASAGLLPHEPPFKILLTDLMLPDVDGASLAKGLLERWPGLKVILMSGYGEDEALRHAEELGPITFLQKPFDLATLARAVHDALAETRSA
jgi:two-component system cell cycle sensor histidine kinase/response regulator CckA